MPSVLVPVCQFMWFGISTSTCEGDEVLVEGRVGVDGTVKFERKVPKPP